MNNNKKILQFLDELRKKTGHIDNDVHESIVKTLTNSLEYVFTIEDILIQKKFLKDAELSYIECVKIKNNKKDTKKRVENLRINLESSKASSEMLRRNFKQIKGIFAKLAKQKKENDILLNFNIDEVKAS